MREYVIVVSDCSIDYGPLSRNVVALHSEPQPMMIRARNLWLDLQKAAGDFHALIIPKQYIVNKDVHLADLIRFLCPTLVAFVYCENDVSDVNLAGWHKILRDAGSSNGFIINFVN